MTDNKILISVIMPVFNSAKFLVEAIDSVLNQTLNDFELIIIDDASNDGSLDIIKKYCDNRIVLVQNNSNQGIVYGLNHGISISKGEYIARMDSDDICDPYRFEIQLKYLLDNNLDVCGSYIQFFGTTNYIKIFPTKLEDIIFLMQFGSPIAHPTALFRKNFFNTIQYKEEYKYVEDLEIWKRAIIEDKKIGNVPSILLKYRTHNNQLSKVTKLIQLDKSCLISLEVSNYFYGNKYIDIFSKYNFGYIESINQIDSYNFLKEYLFESSIIKIEIKIIKHYFISILSRTTFNNIGNVIKIYKLGKLYNLKINPFIYVYIWALTLIPKKTATIFKSLVKKYYKK